MRAKEKGIERERKGEKGRERERKGEKGWKGERGDFTKKNFKKRQ